MWSNRDDYNDNGEAVRFYQPILYGRKPTAGDLTACLVGGFVGPDETTPDCSNCGQSLVLLLQLFLPADHTAFDRCLQVFACNHDQCVSRLFTQERLAAGDGVVVARQRRVEARAVSTSPAAAPSVEAPANEQDDWNVTTTDGDDNDDLEAKLAALETSASSFKAASTTPQTNQKVSQSTARSGCLPCFPLSSLHEPPMQRVSGDMDDDDVGITGSDDKIQQMLRKYMAEEDDEDILAALRGADMGGGGSGGRRGEKDERLSAADRALLTYTDRLKRAPRQVARYAYDGIPLWSIPVNQSKNAPKKPTSKLAVNKPIPPCHCGSPRVFEVQLLSSLLHVLQVDRYAENGSSVVGLLEAFELGGMNWGNIAVYTCPQACGASTEYVVVQESAEGRPMQRRVMGDEPVVVAEDAKFEEHDADGLHESQDDEEDDEEDEDIEEDEEEEGREDPEDGQWRSLG